MYPSRGKRFFCKSDQVLNHLLQDSERDLEIQVSVTAAFTLGVDTISRSITGLGWLAKLDRPLSLRREHKVDKCLIIQVK